MKITITHDQASIDPSATYSDADFSAVRKAYEQELETQLTDAYPNAEVVFIDGSDTYSVRVDLGGKSLNPSEIYEIEDDVLHIVSDVYANGDFWV